VTKPFLGVALGGGGARATAHVGVLQELDNAGINIDLIAGVSSGAMIGAMYAYSQDGRWIEDRFRSVMTSERLNRKVFRGLLDKNSTNSVIAKINHFIINHVVAILSLHKKSVVSNSYLMDIISELIPFKTFDDLRIPLRVISTDIETGKNVIHNSGNIIEALVQSCAIPGVMEPIEYQGSMIVDGGVGMPLPVPIVRSECEYSLAIDIGAYDFERLENPNAKSIKTRSEIITSNQLKKQLADEADFVIRPKTMGLHWTSFESGDLLFKEGRLAAKNSIPLLMKSLKEKKNNRSKKWV
tara:strand:+ start:6151 stop:7044 length:894 start_codon:yes stop_codon:yes gene_type:complete